MIRANMTSMKVVVFWGFEGCRRFFGSFLCLNCLALYLVSLKIFQGCGRFVSEVTETMGVAWSLIQSPVETIPSVNLQTDGLKSLD